MKAMAPMCRPALSIWAAPGLEALDQSPMSQRAASLDKTPEAYWSRVIERAARAFENFVISKMMEQGYQNDYLANVRPIEDFPRSKDRYPYLLPEEVAPIAESFGNLFGTIQIKETDKGVAMFARGAPQTEAFKKWFGESKVVDADGKPLVMYHGTNKSEQGDAFTQFDTYGSNYGLMGQGSYFTDNPDLASSYTKKGRGDAPTVYPV